MLHELLLALNGFPGSIFVKHEDGKIEIVRELPFISPSETALLSRLCRIASCYHYFVTFIRTHGHSANKEIGRALYLKALCQGLDRVLDPYRQKLVDVERELLADPHLTAAFVHNALLEYESPFPAIRLVLEEIIEHKAHGCYILEILYRSAINGIPTVRHAINRILHACHVVMYKQLAAWMLHGMLLDKDNEFFIKRLDKDEEPGNRLQVEDDDDLGIGGITGRQLQQMMLIGEDDPVAAAGEQYTIQADKLPSYIPTSIAQNILFIGESVLMFESDLHDSDWKQRAKGSVIYDHADDFVNDIESLSQQEEFDLMAFEAVISKMKHFVAEKLRHLIVQEADLPGNLKIMKDFYLLGRGELFLAFIDKAHNLLKTVPCATTEHDVNEAFQQAARNVLFDDDLLLQKFHLTVDSGKQGTESKTQSPNKQQKGSADGSTRSLTGFGWNFLRMTYRVGRPLHIMFTPSVIDRYNTLFQFLLHVKRVQMELLQSWALQMQHKHLGKQVDVSTTHWWLRNHMIFLINNLQYYLQVDVIESQFILLLDKIQNTRDFEEIRMAHDTFLTSLLSQSFLLMKPICHCLEEILDLCHRFCSLMMQSDSALTEQEQRLLEEITLHFQRQSSLLFKYLSNVRGHQASPHLAQLLLRIDFNKHFTIVSGQFGK